MIYENGLKKTYKTTIMPQLKTFTFKHIVNPRDTISIEIFNGAERDAWKALGNYVNNIKQWTLK